MLATIFVVIFVVVSIAVIVFVPRHKARSAKRKWLATLKRKPVRPKSEPPPIKFQRERVAAMRKILNDHGQMTYAEGRERLLEMGLYVPAIPNKSAHLETLREHDIDLEGDDAVELIQKILEVSTETACEVFEGVLALDAYKADRNNWDATVHFWTRYHRTPASEQV